jgi:hypothetical protein
VVGAGGKINREEISAIVDKFLAGRRPEQPALASPPEREPARPAGETEAAIEAGSMYAGPGQTARQSEGSRQTGNGGRTAPPSAAPPTSSANGNKTVDFVSEDDVRQAIQKGEKIYINAKTIITPAARDMGEPAEVFAKG